jgi:hypothetical protein
VIGGLLGLTATNVIPALFLAGYLVRVLRAGFAVETIRSEATRPESLVACAVGALGLFGVGVARGLAGLLPLVGPFAGSLVAFYGHVVIARFLGFRYASRTRSDAGGGNAGAAATAD